MPIHLVKCDPLFPFFFNDTATTEIYTLPLHDALPISHCLLPSSRVMTDQSPPASEPTSAADRNSTRLNSSHVRISYAVFCLKKKNTTMNDLNMTSGVSDGGERGWVSTAT